ncbi:uncharacterized protein [Leptinotarsa decemlineata]|uniref:uncharacterized protein n=1 Tax=Leptinotarsa decemlineata TaxID=7539 RepID=UPI000C253DB1|nr:zinc finger protein 486-like [Leptinotarsa decemlineata]
MTTNYCSICQEPRRYSRSFEDKDENGVKWFTKLKSIVSELEQSAECFICNACIEEVECCLKFRVQLLELVSRQKVEHRPKANDTHDNSGSSIGYQKSLEDQEVEDYLQNPVQNDIEYVKNGKEYLNLNYSIGSKSDENLLEITQNETFITNDDTAIDSKRSLIECVCQLCSFNSSSEEELASHHCCRKGCELSKPNEMVELKSSNSEKGVTPSKKRRGRKSTKISTCEVCSQKFNYIKDIIAHCTSIHSMDAKNVKPYTCNKCCQRFSTFANYDQHQKYHERNRDNVCSLCGKGFITKSDLIVHEYTHFNRRNYKCSTCDKAFNTNKNLRTHILVVHTESSSWKYACSICEKKFPLKSNHDQHMKRHSGDKQFVCHICKRSFVTSSELKRHISLHTNMRPFRCEYCKKDYKEMRTLKAHLKQSHSVGEVKIPIREKKYVCHICPSQFYDKQKLSRHLCSHSGVKPYACTSCDKKFTDKSYLKHHVKVFHNTINNIVEEFCPSGYPQRYTRKYSFYNELVIDEKPEGV